MASLLHGGHMALTVTLTTLTTGGAEIPKVPKYLALPSPFEHGE